MVPQALLLLRLSPPVPLLYSGCPDSYAAAAVCHPQAVADEAGRRTARERFQQIKAAYETLRDPERRKAYDRGEALDL